MSRRERPALIKDPVVLKGLTIFLLIAILLIPLAMIAKTIDERARTSRQTEDELIGEYGGRQIIGGPIIVIPYKSKVLDDRGRFVKYENHRAYFLPETLKISGELIPEIRSRGIYDFLLYKADFNISGSFKRPDFSSLKNSADVINWDEAYIEVEISNMKGFRNKPEILVNGEIKSLDTELTRSGVFNGGLFSKFDLDASVNTIEFETNLAIQGGNSVRFIPLGDTTEVNITSTWNDPSFFGEWLPTERLVTEEDGFKAKWYVMSFSRDFASVMDESKTDYNQFSNSYFGVKMMIPVDIYLMTERCVKYGVLFLILPFLTFFLFEIFSKVKVHPFHYLFVGITACLFFLLLIALSEHFTFLTAFIAGVLAVCGLITYYSCYFLKSIKRGVVIFPVMVLAYFFMYMMINSQDYALLMGTLGIFTIVAGVMIATKRVDWYSIGSEKKLKTTPKLGLKD